MKRIRVLVVEDSLTIRRHLCDLLQTDPTLEVVGEATDGKQAIAQCMALRPDVISLDMMLPEMNGLAVTEYVMAHYPTPILVVSSSFNRGELFKTYEALAAGALDVIEKPRADTIDQAWASHYLNMIRLTSRIKVITHLRGKRASQSAPLPPSLPVSTAPSHTACKLIAIGASTGGPRALVEVLQRIPSSCGAPILIVIHIGEPFGNTFAEWLNEQTPHSVRFAHDGETLPAKGVLLAPPGRHLVVQKKQLQLSDEPDRHSCKPSVDVLFESVARECGRVSAACLLTGMGQDGARGLLAIRQAGGLTIAQDEVSSVVYGMPREAALMGAADHILPLHEIGPMLAAYTQSESIGTT
ncbi:chemotaxis-specific protein-glutamate methyltransferase CheB [Chitinivorax sp. B]|uniref:chemotaxis-specific protein-glutamate methyltransferase CheB n=1 Tax=Chitinivorax sp. B TaxID=2502235 RepID=UPI0010F4B936|nr:chemotaxis-specific protein-glutamate methyltransferase CheB [Chitinivorax sp. B]